MTTLTNGCYIEVEIGNTTLAGSFVKVSKGYEQPETLEELGDCEFVMKDEELGAVRVEGWNADYIFTQRGADQ